MKIATPWMRFKCWLLHSRYHTFGSDHYDGATYAVRGCARCGVTIPRAVIYD